MTINTITPFSGYETHRLDQLEQQRQEATKAATVKDDGTDKISISDEGRLKASMLKTANDDAGVRADVVAELKAQIAGGAYKPDSKEIAAGLVRQDLDVWG